MRNDETLPFSHLDFSMDEASFLAEIQKEFDYVEDMEVPWIAGSLLFALAEANRSLPADFWRGLIRRAHADHPMTVHYLLHKLALAQVQGLSLEDFDCPPVPYSEGNWIGTLYALTYHGFDARCLRLHALSVYSPDSEEIEPLLDEIELSTGHIRSSSPVLISTLVRLGDQGRLRSRSRLLREVLRDYDADLVEYPTAPSRLLPRLRTISRRVSGPF